MSKGFSPSRLLGQQQGKRKDVHVTDNNTKLRRLQKLYTTTRASELGEHLSFIALV